MDAQPDAETNSYCPPTTLDSEDSEEETSQEEPPIPSWSDLSIIERVGLNSVEMSETDLETAFSQITLAFRCDQYTLKQRLQAEEHARDLAEENIQLELTRGRETLETLKGLCLDSKRSNILQRLQLSLDILGGTVERISNTAEVLGAVHQEARVSRAVELMVAHVENLRRRHDRNMAELEEAKKAIQQQNSFRNSIDLTTSPDPEDPGDKRKKYSFQISGRRRVSISVISSEIQEKIHEELKRQASIGGSSSKKFFLTPDSLITESSSAVTKDNSNSADDRPPDPDETPSETPAAQLPPELSPTTDPECLPSKQPDTRETQNKNPPLDTVRQRHKGKSASSKKKADKDKKSAGLYRRITAGTYGSSWRKRSLVRWLYRCRWALCCVYLFVLFCVVTLTYFLLEASG